MRTECELFQFPNKHGRSSFGFDNQLDIGRVKLFRLGTINLCKRMNEKLINLDHKFMWFEGSVHELGICLDINKQILGKREI
jgi:hypothetical protein